MACASCVAHLRLPEKEKGGRGREGGREGERGGEREREREREREGGREGERGRESWPSSL